jgi:hypothetical protein
MEKSSLMAYLPLVLCTGSALEGGAVGVEELDGGGVTAGGCMVELGPLGLGISAWRSSSKHCKRHLLTANIFRAKHRR